MNFEYYLANGFIKIFKTKKKKIKIKLNNATMYVNSFLK
jgi:hypothetical protein